VYLARIEGLIYGVALVAPEVGLARLAHDPTAKSLTLESLASMDRDIVRQARPQRNGPPGGRARYQSSHPHTCRQKKDKSHY
jgi:hypothetical protein